MNYQKVYDAIINRSKNRTLEGYREKHHILPKSLGGSNDPSNIAELTAREHFIVHLLLVRIHRGTEGYGKMLKAVMWMSNPRSTCKHVIKSYQYEGLRRQASKEMSLRNIQAVADGTNPWAGPEASEKQRQRALKSIADGTHHFLHLSDECIKNKAVKLRNWWSSLTEQERSQRGIDRWAALSPENQQELRDSFFHRTWEVLSEEQREAKIAKGWETRRREDDQVFAERRSRMVRINLLETVRVPTVSLPTANPQDLLEQFMAEPNDQLFAQCLQSAKSILKLNQPKLALVLGTDQASISTWINGVSRPCVKKQKLILNKISDLLKAQSKLAVL